MNYRDTLFVDELGHLNIGGADTVDLARRFGTPLYVLDEEYVRRVCRAFLRALNDDYGEGTVAYASKAFSAKAIYKIVGEENMSVDVVSMGEMATALSSGFNPHKMYFHGNNKLVSELEYAIKHGIGTIVVDNLEEIDIIDEIASKVGIVQNILFRTNPGVEAHTHNFVQTAKVDSKFGFSIANGDADIAVERALTKNNVKLLGFHSHIGSQIFEKQAFALAVDKLTNYIVHVKNTYDFTTEVLNMGGGFGVWYTDDDPAFSVDEYALYVKNIADTLSQCIIKKGIKKPYLVLEPGRSIVGEAGITLYGVGMIKDIKDVKKYVCIDGGMGDNPRFALYQAKYSAVVANNAKAKPTQRVTLAGKCCESGDIVATVDLPEVKRGDIIAVFTTGAYNYSMASNYNRNPIPPVVLVKDGKADYIVRPQTIEDIIARDVTPEWIK